MNNLLNLAKKYKYLIARRFSQISIIFLYISANLWGWNILFGNLSSSILFNTVPLSDPFAFLQILATGSLVASNLIIGAIIITMFYAIFGGRAFCSWVCPINIVSDFADWLRTKFKIGGESGLRMSRRIRYYLIALTFLVSMIMGVGAFEYISPISILTREIIFGFGFGLGLIFSIFLFDLLFLKNGWCGHICPLGGFYSIIGKFSIFRVHHDSDKCTKCMNCKIVCPESQVLHMIGKDSQPVLSGECTLCGRCIEVCNDDALDFHIRNYGEKA